MLRLIILVVVMVLSSSLAQEVIVEERGTPTQVAPGVTVIIDNTVNDDFMVADELFIHPMYQSTSIPHDHDFTGMQLQLSSKVRTRVIVRTNSENLVVSGGEEVVLPAGSRITLNMTAYQPHDGIISIYNTEGDLLGQVGYSVAKESRLRHTINGSVSTSMSTDFTDVNLNHKLSVGYRLSDRVTGISGSFGMDYDGNFVLRGTVGGSYSW